MIDKAREPDTSSSVGAVPDPGAPPRMPRWVKWPMIILGVLIALFLVLRLFGVEHGPGRHAPGDQPAGTPGVHAPADSRG